MPDFSWLQEEEQLTSEALTVRAQTIDPDDAGRIFWDVFFPRADGDSVRIHELTTLDFRPVSDRREWNQRGRYVPLETPDRRDVEMIPIEAYFKIEEQEIQRLAEQSVAANTDRFREIIGARVPDRTDELVMANFRRIELDAFEAWANGQIAVKNPQTGATGAVSLGFDASRYETAGTDWATASNGYEEFLAWIEGAIDKVGQVEGAIMRLATFKEIQADAPNPMAGAQSGLQPTREQLRQRVEDELGTAFRFVIMEESHDVFDDAGAAYTRTKAWPAQHVAAIPAGTVVGNTVFAPVARAVELARNAPGAGIDIRGQTVYHDAAGAGRELTVEAQVNALPLPDEQRVAVIDAGV